MCGKFLGVGKHLHLVVDTVNLLSCIAPYYCLLIVPCALVWYKVENFFYLLRNVKNKILLLFVSKGFSQIRPSSEKSSTVTKCVYWTWTCLLQQLMHSWPPFTKPTPLLLNLKGPFKLQRLSFEKNFKTDPPLESLAPNFRHCRITTTLFFIMALSSVWPFLPRHISLRIPMISISGNVSLNQSVYGAVSKYHASEVFCLEKTLTDLII